MSLVDKINVILQRYNDLQNKLQDPTKLSNEQMIEINKEIVAMGSIVSIGKDYIISIRELSELYHEVGECIDEEMRKLMNEEILSLKQRVIELEYDVKLAMIAKEKDDDKNVILEIRSGTGGEEAALFVSDLLRMYNRYADSMRWGFDIMSASGTGIGGYKEVIVSITGVNVFFRLKFESGVHRVQRVPKTESGGRIHTSAATVAILPAASEIDVHINPKDIRVDVYRASCNGGQSVNTTDSAVRITHIPTGLVVTQQDEKSQHKNKNKAMKVLMARLYDREKQLYDRERASDRRSQVGSGDRSERIRTYNFHQGRITDHRVNMTMHKMDEILYDGKIDELIDALIIKDQSDKISKLYDE